MHMITYIAFTFCDHFGRKFHSVKSFTGSFDEIKSACDEMILANSQHYKTTWRCMSTTEVRSYKYGVLLNHLHIQDAEVEELAAVADAMSDAVTDANKLACDYGNLESYTNELERLIAQTSSIKALRAAVAALKQ